MEKMFILTRTTVLTFKYKKCRIIPSIFAQIDSSLTLIINIFWKFHVLCFVTITDMQNSPRQLRLIRQHLFYIQLVSVCIYSR